MPVSAGLDWVKRMFLSKKVVLRVVFAIVEMDICRLLDTFQSLTKNILPTQKCSPGSEKYINLCVVNPFSQDAHFFYCSFSADNFRSQCNLMNNSLVERKLTFYYCIQVMLSKLIPKMWFYANAFESPTAIFNHRQIKLWFFSPDSPHKDMHILSKNKLIKSF